ncbi:MAG TPA: TonB-dependent receptor [Bacteroidales bacterium]|nr:TonB-dependent receptor [Bacteroidales bacterium]
MKYKLLFVIAAILTSTLEVVVAQRTVPGIHGHVYDEKGEPLAGAGISVANTLSGTYSGSDGSYEIKLRDTGKYTVVFIFLGYEKLTKEVEATGSVSLDAVMTRALLMTDEVIVSATRAGTKTPVAYSGVSGDAIRRQNNGQDIPYMLSLTPSLVETSEAGTGIGYTNLRIRGTDANRINVTIDGIPLNDPESQQVFWVDLPDLASSVANMQVQRGVGTSSNGSGAFGASVNILTKSPDTSAVADISTTAGSFNTLKNTIVAGTGLIKGRFALQMRYSDVKSDGYVKRTSTNNRSGTVSAIYRTANSLLKANIIIGEEHTGISWWGVPSDSLSTDRRFNPAGMYTDQAGAVKFYNNESDNYWQNHYQLIYSRSLGRFVSLHAAFHYTTGKGYYEEYAEDQNYAGYGLQNVKTGDSTLTSTDLVRQKWMSNDFYGVVYSLSVKKGNLDAVLGGSANLYKGRYYGNIIWMRNAGTSEKDYQWYFNRSGKREFSIYGRLNYRFSSLLSGFADMQYRNIFYRLSGIDEDFVSLKQEHNYNFFNPKAGLFLSVSSTQDAYISFSVANKEPTRSDFEQAKGDPSATPRSETLYDAEAGYNLRAGRLNVGVNLYHMFYNDQLIPTGQLSDVGYPIMTNVKKSSRTGIELSAEWKPARIFDWKAGVTLSRSIIPGYTEYYLDYNTTDWSSVYKSKDYGTVEIAYSPSITGMSDMSFTLSRKINIHLACKYVGKQYFDNTMSENRKIDPYFVSNIIVNFSAPVGKMKELYSSLYLNNILNTMYVSNGYGGLWYENGVEKTWAYFFPQAGMNFLLKIGLRF